MLIVSRKQREGLSLTIDQEGLEALLAEAKASGQPVIVTVVPVKVQPSRVRLGVHAPRQFTILRDELSENPATAGPPPAGIALPAPGAQLQSGLRP